MKQDGKKREKANKIMTTENLPKPVPRAAAAYDRQLKRGHLPYTATVKTLQMVTNKPYVNEVTLTGQNPPLKCS